MSERNKTTCLCASRISCTCGPTRARIALLEKVADAARDILLWIDPAAMRRVNPEHPACALDEALKGLDRERGEG